MNSFSFLTNRGMSYPFSMDGAIELASGTEYIRSGIKAYLDIAYFELLFRPEGSRIRELLFEPIDEILYDSLLLFISDALQEYDLIEFDSVQIAPPELGDDPNTVGVLISYRINKPNISDILLYTFISNPLALEPS